jgi:DNA-directed RNA polymerase subunit RPC12/RpoP
MTRVPITIMGYRCERCTHEWAPKSFDKEPKVCPKCKSPYWNTPRSKAMMTYEAFRDAIRKVLLSNGGDLTWTEIRTSAKLPQAFPNNQWVHKMETDIGLKREKDSHGIIRWRLKEGESVAGQSPKTS